MFKPSHYYTKETFGHICKAISRQLHEASLLMDNNKIIKLLELNSSLYRDCDYDQYYEDDMQLIHRDEIQIIESIKNYIK